MEIRAPYADRVKSAEYFFTAIEQRRISLPFCPALVEDLYDAYRAWAILNGMEAQAINKVIPAIMRFAGVRRVELRVPELEEQPARRAGRYAAQKRRKRRVLLIGYRPELEASADARGVVRGLREFRHGLRVLQAHVRSTLAPRSPSQSAVARV